MKWTGKMRFVVVILLWSFSMAATAASFGSIDTIVAVVNDDVILSSELEVALHKFVLKRKEKGGQLPPRSVFERKVLERLINEHLQLEAARKAGIKIDDDTLNKAIGNIARRNGMALSEMRSVLEKEGLNFRDFRKQISDQLTLQGLRMKEVKRRVRVTEQEIDSYLLHNKGRDRTEFHMLHILFSIPGSAAANEIKRVLDEAEKLVSRLRKGADFESAAMTLSKGRNALEGGDLGWRKADQVPTIFSKLVGEMKRGDVSDPIRSNSGFHIIKLLDFRGKKKILIDQTKARHILVRTNEVTSDKDAKIRLQQLRQRIVGGTDFATLARGHSDDKGSALKGGDLGWVATGDVVPEFEDQMKKLGKNEMSKPFKTEFGWHIVQVLDRRSHDGTKELLKAEARNSIGMRKLDEEYELYVRRLRDEAYVDIRLDNK